MNNSVTWFPLIKTGYMKSYEKPIPPHHMNIEMDILSNNGLALNKLIQLCVELRWLSALRECLPVCMCMYVLCVYASITLTS